MLSIHLVFYYACVRVVFLNNGGSAGPTSSSSANPEQAQQNVEEPLEQPAEEVKGSELDEPEPSAHEENNDAHPQVNGAAEDVDMEQLLPSSSFYKLGADLNDIYEGQGQGNNQGEFCLGFKEICKIRGIEDPKEAEKFCKCQFDQALEQNYKETSWKDVIEFYVVNSMKEVLQ